MAPVKNGSNKLTINTQNALEFMILSALLLRIRLSSTLLGAWVFISKELPQKQSKRTENRVYYINNTSQHYASHAHTAYERLTINE